MLRRAPMRLLSTDSVQGRIESKLKEALSPQLLRVEDTSGGCGSFFRVVVVSPKFAGLSVLKQQR
mgnify:CR=1 FL=1